MKITRKDYMEGRISHLEYYAHVADILGIKFTQDDYFRGYSLKKSYERDENFNSIPLHFWDSLAKWRTVYEIPKKLFEVDPCFGSLCDLVCAYKAAAARFVITEAAKEAIEKLPNKIILEG